jgi:UDP-N-acetylglucosamine--N-acetylmuramyl-(pentapeptide) pyrophosphoryl-undecaprenol N-acetylglucosamine transferase
MNERMDMIIVCGGTGGHVYPALAVAEEYRRKYPERKMMFVLKNGGFEEKVIRGAGFPFRSIRMEGFNRSRMLLNTRLLLLLPISLVKAFLILLRARPCLVLSTGGYTGVPVLLSAVLQGRKIALQEQNSYPGFTVRFFSRFARIIFLAYREAAGYLPRGKKIIETGNPLRLATGAAPTDIRKVYGLGPEDRILFVFGGSQGARAINEAVLECVARLARESRIAVLWQTGRPDFERIKEAISGMDRIWVLPFIENIYDYYRAADLAVCRAGAMTVSELAMFGLPAIFVPLPTAAEDHQTLNARMAESHGAGLCLPQTEVRQKLCGTVLSLLNDAPRLAGMREKMTRMHRKNAAPAIVDALEKEMAA